MTRADKLLTAAILLCALIGLAKIYHHFFIPLAQLSPAQATITAKGNVIRTIDLDPAGAKQTLQITGRLGSATVEVDKGKVRMLAATCPNQICVKQGWIQNSGASIVCLPGEIIIHLDGPTTVDAVTR
jgi:hypothetical protein